jgi:DNA ligase 1
MMNKREFLMLAKPYTDQNIRGWFASIKYDGMRCFWDGGFSRGKRKCEVAWANLNKDDRYLREQISTGLWSRYGNVIHAPPQFLDQLPKHVLLDGELYLGLGRFQETRSIVSKQEPDVHEWSNIRFMVFDRPHPRYVFATGEIKNPNMHLYVQYSECMEHLQMERWSEPVMNFREINHSWPDIQNETVRIVYQYRLPKIGEKAKQEVRELAEEEHKRGGEGLILRDPDQGWIPKRVSHVLKVKRREEGRAIVRGYTDGVGKYQGMIGALIVEDNGVQFELSGMTDDQRQNGRISIPVGSVVKYAFAGLTDAGIPREARYVQG